MKISFQPCPNNFQTETSEEGMHISLRSMQSNFNTNKVYTHFSSGYIRVKTPSIN